MILLIDWFEEHLKRSSEPGKLAESDNPYPDKPGEVCEIKVMMTIVGGNSAYEARDWR